MKQNVAKVVSGIRVKNKGMKLRNNIFIWGVCLACISILFSCGSAKKTSISSKNLAETVSQDLLSPEERRKFDYFFLEAVRLKEKGTRTSMKRPPLQKSLPGATPPERISGNM